MKIENTKYMAVSKFRSDLNDVIVNRKKLVRLYGPKVIENLCQAIARCIIAEQMVEISKRYRG